MITTADFKNGLTIEVEGEAYQILEFQHVKPGKGGAFVRTRLKGVRSGNVFDRTFRAGERVELANVRRQTMQFLYRAGGSLHFMNMETFDEMDLSEEVVGEVALFLKEGTEVQVVSCEGEVLGVEPPLTVALKVAETAPGGKGDTATGSGKPATLETGAVVQVPFFINDGDMIKVDTRTGRYVERVA
jgi:elongation factor P